MTVSQLRQALKGYRDDMEVWLEIFTYHDVVDEDKEIGQLNRLTTKKDDDGEYLLLTEDEDV